MPRREEATPTLEEVERATGEPAPRWIGRCYTIAATLNDKLKLGRTVYGHWLGPISRRSFFASRRHAGFCQHGWIDAGGRIIDPTRWAFEVKSPYVFTGADEEGYYDEGGDKFRRAMTAPPPAPDDPNTRAGRPLPLKIADEAACLFVKNLLGRWPWELSWNQVFWLANLSRQDLGDHITPVFLAICEADERCLIPLDNYRFVFRGGE